MQDFEKLGLFYLGRTIDPARGEDAGDLLLYDARDLTTHALLVGMTGSGKTGLALTLLEEAAIDGIPALLIDPKGDLTNLLLQFPELQADQFRPWVDEAEGARQGLTPEALAARTAARWRAGLAQWGQDGDRIRRLRDSAEFTIYTPGAQAGRPLQLFRSFAAPPPTLLADATAFRERVLAAVSGLLGLLGLQADPLRSRDHILLATILDRAWRAGQDLELPSLIREVRQPSFDQVGVLDLESFYPSRERFKLALTLNNLLAAPGFAAWTTGEPLDIQQLLRTPEGRPRHAILYLAHLAEPERMFFITILLSEVLAWMRTQSGTGSLRALLYMDEIFGYFPPVANPPTKQPMLTLLKQARAFGLGVVLSTQNPVDLDYKGLANCGTWFIGRLQTERDRLRILDGLAGVAASQGAAFDRPELERLLSGLGQRVFLQRNVHEPGPQLFRTRWTLSYLCGPLTLPQVAALSSHAPVTPQPIQDQAPARPASGHAPDRPGSPRAHSTAPPILPPEVPVYYRRPSSGQTPQTYHPRILGLAQLHFVDAKAGLDVWGDRTLLAPLPADGGEVAWELATPCPGLQAELERLPQPGIPFLPLPARAAQPKSYAAWSRSLASWLHQTATLELWSCPSLKLFAAHGEPAGAFQARVLHRQRELRDQAVQRLRERYTPKLRTLEDRLQRALERVAREQAQADRQKVDTALSIGATLLGAFLGRGVLRSGNVGRATSAARSASRIGQEAAEVARAADQAEEFRARLDELTRQFEEEVAALQLEYAPTALTFEPHRVRPRKADIRITTCGLCWEVGPPP